MNLTPLSPSGAHVHTAAGKQSTSKDALGKKPKKGGVWFLLSLCIFYKDWGTIHHLKLTHDDLSSRRCHHDGACVLALLVAYLCVSRAEGCEVFVRLENVRRGFGTEQQRVLLRRDQAACARALFGTRIRRARQGRGTHKYVDPSVCFPLPTTHDLVWQRDRERMGKYELRQWQWIVRALWSAASKMALGDDQQQQQRHGQGAGAGSAAGTPAGLSSRRPMCQLQLLVPDTILFERGEPCKWIGCSPEGIVVRKSFVRAAAASIRSGSSTSSTVTSSVAETSTAAEIRHATLAERTGPRYQPSSSGAMDEVEVMERMDIVLAALSSFAAGGTESLSTSSPSAAGTGGMDRNSPLCVARYNDGTMEFLSETSLRALSSFYNWRASLCALQAYVCPSTSTGTRTIGTYVRRDEQPNSTRAPMLPKTTRDESRVRPEPTTDFNSGCSHAGDDEPRRDKHSTMRTFSSVGAAPSEASSTASPGAMVAADGGTLAGPATQALAAELDEATKDVAFVADMSYARPIESPPRAARRMSTATAPSQGFQGSDEGINSVGSQPISSGRDQPATPSVYFIGGPTGQPRRCRPPWPKSRVRISRLEAEYVIDQAGRAWFTKATKVFVCNTSGFVQ